MFGLDFSVSKKLLKRAWLRDWERACTLKTKDTNIQGCILILVLVLVPTTSTYY